MQTPGSDSQPARPSDGADPQVQPAAVDSHAVSDQQTVAGSHTGGDPRTAKDVGDARGITPPAVPVRTIHLVQWGILAWALALVVLLAFPDLRAGERSWWLWVPVAGILLGGLGYVYLRRGRGNAVDA
ncbi:hypothetical protein ACQBAT_02525 [Ornithinimicrobium sp. Y1847]|uniref:hypothetical protein n=1 Tax=Ornithinimicrobium sp. Y1847 TaxID=3405419 RepID=UPI003B66CD5F